MSDLSIINTSNKFAELKELTKVDVPKKHNLTEYSLPQIKTDSFSLRSVSNGKEIPNIGFGIIAPEGWGSRSQISGTFKDLLDVKGNNDGLWDNEKEIKGTIKQFKPDLPGKPLADKISESVCAGSIKDEIEGLKNFKTSKEKLWGQPITNLNLNQLKDGDLFAVQKAIALTRLDRKPGDVIDGFVHASGKVNGIKIDDREVFYQRFKPIGEPNGKVVVVSPGFQETGRNFYEQIQDLNKHGFDVVVMDHQWAGQTKGGEPGGIDRGFGVARDVASVAAFADKEIVQMEYKDNPNHELILFGNSMGAGPGVLGAITMNDNGKIELDGIEMPKNVKAVLQAPFLKSSPEILNKGINALSHVPLLNKMELPSSGLPILTHDRKTAQKGTQGAILEDVRAQLKSMSAANEDLETLINMIKDGNGPKGQISIVHADKDPLADPKQSKWLTEQLGKNASLNIITSNNHVLEQNETEKHFAIDALSKMIGK